MPRYKVTSDRLSGRQRGEVVDLDPAAVNIPALIAAGHIRPALPEPTRRASGGNVRAR